MFYALGEIEKAYENRNAKKLYSNLYDKLVLVVESTYNLPNINNQKENMIAVLSQPIFDNVKVEDKQEILDRITGDKVFSRQVIGEIKRAQRISTRIA